MVRKVMPIMGGTICSEIPWGLISPHEQQARKNHGQTLDRLAERGGLGHSEAIDIIEGRKWGSSKHCVENEHYLINLVRQWRATHQPTKEAEKL